MAAFPCLFFDSYIPSYLNYEIQFYIFILNIRREIVMQDIDYGKFITRKLFLIAY